MFRCCKWHLQSNTCLLRLTLSSFRSRLQLLSLLIHFPLPNQKSYYTLKRIRKADNIPLFYEIFFLPTTLFNNLSKHVSDKFSITSLIQNEYGYHDLKSECLITAVNLDDSLSQLLEVEFNSAAIKFDIIHYNEKNELVFFKISYFPGERHSIDVNLREETLWNT